MVFRAHDLCLPLSPTPQHQNHENFFLLSLCFNFTHGFHCSCFSDPFFFYIFCFPYSPGCASPDLLWLQVWECIQNSNRISRLVWGVFNACAWSVLLFLFECPIVAACQHERIPKVGRRYGRICFFA
ncbi:hypothetical protein P170DRAFT_204810 [Aspergillus steynii IBT 23096]|uniref:Uncharacterized protein n=1 Tax=Aspergillus steynii IBT 23096 TaxID=1392250 RepID=A0A2I2G5C6_9EURO|nr:uncharacterized protein P170DRAFT_204810 [Aspergillus steynii IBT 23096]PLB48053.1 hypothetical protein P170DRAFT_204810 [Aspergillus steynii IBT 23096]